MDYEAIKREMDATGLDEETARQIVAQRGRETTGDGQWGQLGGAADLPLWRKLKALKEEQDQRPRRSTSPPLRPRPAPSWPPPAPDAAEEPPAAPACSRCRDAGYLVADAPVGHPDFGRLIPCACAFAAQEARAAESRQRRAQGLLHRLQVDLGVDLVEATFATFNPRWPADVSQQADLHKALVKARVYATAPAGWLYLYGDRGNGKSHLAAAIAQAASVAGTPTVYASVPRQLDFVKDGFRDRSSVERLESLMDAELLILDDFGTEQKTDWAAATLFTLVNERYQQGRATVFTSNLHPDAVARRSKDPSIADQYERIADRIVGQCQAGGLIELRGASYRRR